MGIVRVEMRERGIFFNWRLKFRGKNYLQRINLKKEVEARAAMIVKLSTSKFRQRNRKSRSWSLPAFQLAKNLTIVITLIQLQKENNKNSHIMMGQKIYFNAILISTTYLTKLYYVIWQEDNTKRIHEAMQIKILSFCIY